MTRGRKPLMAMSEALAIARKRGEVRQFMHEPGRICDFVIYCLGNTAHVRIKRVTRVRCPHAWIEAEAADALATLRAIAAGTGISRELWVFLPRGAFRFFRIEQAGLVELSRDGAVTVPKTWADVLSQQSAGTATIPPVQAPPPESSDGNICHREVTGGPGSTP